MDKDISIAFVGTLPGSRNVTDLNIPVETGDLKNILRTINSLPDDFSGALDIVVNDPKPIPACLMLFLLVILGSDVDDTVAVDMALHHWLSAFEPNEYHIHKVMIYSQFMASCGTRRGEGDAPRLHLPAHPMGQKGSNILFWGPSITSYFQKFEEGMMLSVGIITLKYPEARVAYEHSRLGGDDWDRVLAPLTPSHRVAFGKYRETGTVLPFGAPRAHFGSPNSHFFSNDRCLLPPLADPLQGWE